jgi:hypothetical protein
MKHWNNFQRSLEIDLVETLANLESFVRSAEAEGFSVAARWLTLSPAAVSRNVLRWSAISAFGCFSAAHESYGWAEAGSAGWDFNSVLPLFQKAEDWEDGASEFRGAGGPIHVERARDLDLVSTAFIDAGQSYGMPYFDDVNIPEPEGVGPLSLNVRDGARCSPFLAYLRPVMGHRNLTVRTEAQAVKLALSGTRCTGLDFLQGGQLHSVGASREVILCAGAIHTLGCFRRRARNSVRRHVFCGGGEGDEAGREIVTGRALRPRPAGRVRHRTRPRCAQRPLRRRKARDVWRPQRRTKEVMTQRAASRRKSLPPAGLVQREQNRVRVNAQLIDAESGAHLWADGFEEDVADLFKLQDEVAARLARSLDLALGKAEAEKAAHSRNPDAVDLTMRTYEMDIRGPDSKSANLEERALFERALQIDPNDAEALAGTAETFMSDWFKGWAPGPTATPKSWGQPIERSISHPKILGCTSQRPSIWPCRAGPAKASVPPTLDSPSIRTMSRS